jgi:hypothetical protein
MWTLANRSKYNRDHLRYPSDLTDDEWAYVEPLIPPAKPGGGKRRTDMRARGVVREGRIGNLPLHLQSQRLTGAPPLVTGSPIRRGASTAHRDRPISTRSTCWCGV